jgi:hypothetical protein
MLTSPRMTRDAKFLFSSAQPSTARWIYFYAKNSPMQSWAKLDFHFQLCQQRKFSEKLKDISHRISSRKTLNINFKDQYCTCASLRQDVGWLNQCFFPSPSYRETRHNERQIEDGTIDSASPRRNSKLFGKHQSAERSASWAHGSLLCKHRSTALRGRPSGRSNKLE